MTEVKEAPDLCKSPFRSSTNISERDNRDVLGRTLNAKSGGSFPRFEQLFNCRDKFLMIRAAHFLDFGYFGGGERVQKLYEWGSCIVLKNVFEDGREDGIDSLGTSSRGRVRKVDNLPCIAFQIELGCHFAFCHGLPQQNTLISVFLSMSVTSLRE
jgi:hypothetical protein